ncbi:helix-turn-helix domain-containing protein [Castellaniella sp.]|uniref:helix-turn-helix domain-containing protein n=1 Tax=Castellaniella sp. TaxID=1955812 RepID=UPI002AFEFC13|nr:helix-turn-helix domain-containing protein [Castellaniella sp.]
MTTHALERSSENQWSHISLSNLESLSDAVYGAGLDIVQMSRAPISGSLGFMAHDDVRCSTGLIGAKVALSGPLSEDQITLGVGITMPSGTRHWLHEAASGDIGVFMPNDEHDSLYMPNSLYAVITLSEDRLEEIAAEHDIVLTARSLGGTGFFGRQLPEKKLLKLRRLFQDVHTSADSDIQKRIDPIKYLTTTLVTHLGRPPRTIAGIRNPQGHTRVFQKARAFIHENLDSALTVEMIAHAAATSTRTLHRAFILLLGETPYAYVQKLRLHRIRHELISNAELTSTLASITNRWGLSELGRSSGWYRDLFGELPSETRKKLRSID